MATKKSQLSMFLILILVVAILFGVFVYVGSTVKKRIKTETGASAQLGATANQVKQFVTLCLEKTAREGLIMWGKQGGVIYQSQGGLTPNWQSSDEGVFYLAQVNEPECKSSNGAENTCFVAFRLKNVVSGNDPLTNQQAPPQFPRLRETEIGVGVSLERQLESYVRNQLSSCAKFGEFEKQGLTISSTGLISPLVTVGLTEVNVKLDYPLAIENPAVNAKTNIKDYFVKVPVRLDEIRSAVAEMIHEETRNKIFDISRPVLTSVNPDILQAVYRIPDIADGMPDVILIADSNHDYFIDGIPFKFQFARANRVPEFDGIPGCIDPTNIEEEIAGLNIKKKVKINVIPRPTYFDFDEEDKPSLGSINGEVPESGDYVYLGTDDTVKVPYIITDGLLENTRSYTLAKCP